MPAERIWESSEKQGIKFFMGIAKNRKVSPINSEKYTSKNLEIPDGKTILFEKTSRH